MKVLFQLAVLAAPFVVIFFALRAVYSGNKAYHWGAAIGLAAAFLIIWVALAVGIIGDPGDLADGMYVVVLAVGGVGALIARFKPAGMARTLFATAMAQAIVPVIALGTGIQQISVTPIASFVGLNAILVALFVLSALLFRTAAREHAPAGAVPAG